jgi:hypothetical protein
VSTSLDYSNLRRIKTVFKIRTAHYHWDGSVWLRYKETIVITSPPSNSKSLSSLEKISCNGEFRSAEVRLG